MAISIRTPEHFPNRYIPLAAKMLDVRTAIGFSLSCSLSENGPHVFLSAKKTHLESIVAGGRLGGCRRHDESSYDINTVD